MRIGDELLKVLDLMTIGRGNQREISINLDFNREPPTVSAYFDVTTIQIEGFDPGSE